MRHELGTRLPVVRCTKATLVHLSHTLEDLVLRHNIPALLFTGFQESSHWREETRRYRALVDVAQQVCIFAGGALPPESNAKELHITLHGDDPLRQDAAAIAADLGITPAEALRRLELQDAVSRLENALAAEHPDTFAGLWIQHEPVYRIVVAFTQDGAAIIRPYITGTPLEADIDVRTAAASHQELQAAQTALRRQLNLLKLGFDSGLNVPANQVEVYVTDHPLFAQRMAEAGVTLPPQVVVITTHEPVGAAPPFPVTPVPSVDMPQLRVRSGAMMQALLSGTLIVEDGCLRVREEGGDTRYLVIWQPDYYLSDRDGTRVILDRDGHVVAQVDAPIRLSGGVTSAGVAELNPQLQAPIPVSCGGPAWRMGQIEP
ncbi:MAG: hypothetical protein HC828_17270 [Blastochloris sp.]|nr:hypothetical protein [Blastochloris sp.]